MKWIKRIPLLAAALYLLAVAACGACAIYGYESSAADHGETAGMYLALLTLPWSLFLDPFLRVPDASIYWDVGRITLYGFVNAAIIYAAFALLMRLAGTNSKPAA
jgi:hypothetical protein